MSFLCSSLLNLYLWQSDISKLLKSDLYKQLKYCYNKNQSVSVKLTMKFNSSILSTKYASHFCMKKRQVLALTGLETVGYCFIHRTVFLHISITYAFLLELGRNSRTNRSSFVNYAFIFHLLFPFASTQCSLFIVQSRSPNSVQCSLTVHSQCDLRSYTIRSEFVHRSCWKVERRIFFFLLQISEILKSIFQEIY